MAESTSYRFIGDEEAGRTLIGLADQQMSILQQQMKFQSLKQLSRTLDLYGGVSITVRDKFGIKDVVITVPSMQYKYGKEDLGTVEFNLWREKAEDDDEEAVAFEDFRDLIICSKNKADYADPYMHIWRDEDTDKLNSTGPVHYMKYEDNKLTVTGFFYDDPVGYNLLLYAKKSTLCQRPQDITGDTKWITQKDDWYKDEDKVKITVQHSKKVETVDVWGIGKLFRVKVHKDGDPSDTFLDIDDTVKFIIKNTDPSTGVMIQVQKAYDGADTVITEGEGFKYNWDTTSKEHQVLFDPDFRDLNWRLGNDTAYFTAKMLGGCYNGDGTDAWQGKGDNSLGNWPSTDPEFDADPYDVDIKGVQMANVDLYTDYPFILHEVNFNLDTSEIKTGSHIFPMPVFHWEWNGYSAEPASASGTYATYDWTSDPGNAFTLWHDTDPTVSTTYYKVDIFRGRLALIKGGVSGSYTFKSSIAYFVSYSAGGSGEIRYNIHTPVSFPCADSYSGSWYEPTADSPTVCGKLLPYQRMSYDLNGELTISADDGMGYNIPQGGTFYYTPSLDGRSHYIAAVASWPDSITQSVARCDGGHKIMENTDDSFAYAVSTPLYIAYPHTDIETAL